MEISQTGIDLIAKYESFRSKPYLCPADRPTIGYGSTYYSDGTPVKLTDAEISKEDAKNLLKVEANKIVNQLCNLGILFNQNQIDALTSLFYNMGTAKMKNPKTTIGRALANRDHAEIASAFLIYDKATIKSIKTTLPGLTKRRQEEHNLYKKEPHV